MGFPAGIVNSARPLKTSFEADSSTARIAWVEGPVPVPPTLGLQPEIVPSSVAKRKIEGAVFLPSVTLKPEPLKTTPEGAEVSVLPAGGGMLTTGRLTLRFPALSKTLEVPEPLLLSQKSPGL